MHIAVPSSQTVYSDSAAGPARLQFKERWHSGNQPAGEADFNAPHAITRMELRRPVGLWLLAVGRVIDN